MLLAGIYSRLCALFAPAPRLLSVHVCRKYVVDLIREAMPETKREAAIYHYAKVARPIGEEQNLEHVNCVNFITFIKLHMKKRIFTSV
jgi:hypothetical protein